MNGSQNGMAMNDFDGAGAPGPSSTNIHNDANAVFVTNLQWWTTDVDLEGVCSVYGPVKGVRFIEDRACGKSRGMAVVEFAEYSSSQACIENLGGTFINGRPCKVQRQQQRPPGGGGGGGGPGMMMGGMMPGGRGGMMPGRGGGRVGGRGRGDPGMMMGMAPGGPMDPSMMQGMPPPWGMGGGGGGGGMMPPQMLMGGGMPPRGPPGGGFAPPPPPGAPGY